MKKLYIRLRQSGEVKEVKSIIRYPSKELSAHYFDRIDKDGWPVIGGIPLTACDLCDSEGRLLVAEDTTKFLNQEQTQRVSKMLDKVSQEAWTAAKSTNVIPWKEWWAKRNKVNLNTPSEGKEEGK